MCEPLHVDVPPLDDSVIAAPEQTIFDPTGKGMENFYERLARLMRGKAKDHVRVAIYGDSNMTMDFIAGPLRRNLQQTFGDAGHGFIALARPWSHYRHIDVVQEVGHAFDSYAITTKPTGDGAYGIAGIVGDSPSPGSKVRIATARDGAPVGRSASRFDLFYLTGPRRGDIEIQVDGKSMANLSSEAPARGVGIARVEVQDGPHQFDSIVRSPKWVRFLGSAVERDTPGVVVDNLGVGAMNTKCITLMQPEFATPILDYRRYDLVILMTGTADIYMTDEAPKIVEQVVALHRKSRPNVSFLLVAPPDRGVSHATKHLLVLEKQRREAAAQLGVAFWDLFAAMGGAESMMKFMRKQIALPDQIHFAEGGGRWVSLRLHRALMQGFATYLEAHPDAGCAERGEPEQEPWPSGAPARGAGTDTASSPGGPSPSPGQKSNASASP